MSDDAVSPFGPTDDLALWWAILRLLVMAGAAWFFLLAAQHTEGNADWYDRIAAARALQAAELAQLPVNDNEPLTDSVDIGAGFILGPEDKKIDLSIPAGGSTSDLIQSAGIISATYGQRASDAHSDANWWYTAAVGAAAIAVAAAAKVLHIVSLYRRSARARNR